MLSEKTYIIDQRKGKILSNNICAYIILPCFVRGCILVCIYNYSVYVNRITL